MDKTHSSYGNMVARCHNPRASGYARYGGIGVSVCDRWRGKGGFANFRADMGERPDGHSIDRIDSRGNYEPGNCRWATLHEQNRNKSNNRVFIYRGKPYVLADLARLAGFSKSVLRLRLIKDAEHWTVERAVETPITPKETQNGRAVAIDYNGETYPSMGALARATGVKWYILNARLKYGWTVEDAIRIPVSSTRKYPSAQHRS